METIKISKQVTEFSNVLAYISLISIGTFLLLLILLHILKPALSPVWRMVSEYAIGGHGWMMQLAFGCLAVSCLTFAIAGWPQVSGTGGRIGMALLVIAAIGLTMAAFYNTDPVNTPKTEMSPHGKMHGFGFMIGVPSLTAAIILISLNLRTSYSWAWAKQPLLWLAQLPWISIIAMVTIMLVLLPKNEGKFGPAVCIGLPNRLWVLACCAWLMVVASGIIKLKKEQAPTTMINSYNKE